MFRRTFAALTTAAMLASCAMPADQIGASYVSPTRYTNMSCDELGYELNVVSHQIATASVAQNSKASSDAAAVAIGLIAFWPALLFVGNGDNSSALSSMKGDFNAMLGAAQRNRC